MLALRVLIASLLLAASASAEVIRVAVAISLKEAMEGIVTTYEADTANRVELTFGSSGQLLAQIKNGAEIDAFISAANAQIDDLNTSGLGLPETRRVIAGNRLVLVVPAGAEDAPTSFESLGGTLVKKLAIGEPRTVPAGQYASQVLSKLGLADQLKDRIVYGANVRQVLTYVELGEVSAGIVYSTDAKESGDKVKVIAIAKPELHEPIVYPAIVIKASKKQETAKGFLDYLSTDKARAVLSEKGFSTGLRAS